MIPDDLAVVAIERDHAAVGQVCDDKILPQRNAAGLGHAAFVLNAGIADPDEIALVGVAGVDLVDRAPAVARIHEAVVDERIDLVFRPVLSNVLHAAERKRPDKAEVFDVLAIDLRQLGIALRSEVAVHHQPVLRLVLRVDQAIIVDSDRVALLLGEGG